MNDDVISLSSDSSRPGSPFFGVSDIFDDSGKRASTETAVNDKKLYLFLNSVRNDDSRSTSATKKSSTSSPAKGRVYHDLSDSDGSENENVLKWKDSNIATVHKSLSPDKLSSLPDALSDTSENEKPVQRKKRKSNSLTLKKKAEHLGNAKKLSKEKRLEEKHLKQLEKERRKAEKLAAQQIKPGNCMKHMTISLDTSLVTCSFGGMLLAAIQNTECKHNVLSSAVPYSVAWKRDLPESKYQDERDVILIWPWQNVIPAIENHSLCSQIQDIKMLNPGKSITLTIFGLNGYYSYLKTKRKGKNNTGDNQEYPYMTRKEIEEELIELQIMHDCNHRLIESAEELGQFIVQVTKAIAEIPFKREKHKREQEKLEWFATGDSRDCVAVDKAGNGLMRLWQQQLCQFNLAGHDVAQAIAAVYPGPAAIMRAYDKCTSQKEGEDLLKDIAVRRCQGPLTSSRRIGPELSKKVYMFFNSANGDAPLLQ